MVWTSWADRIDTLPQVLAGPILRRVEPGSVTVWVAMRTAFTVTLRVFDTGASDLEVMRGNRESLQLAPNLHVTAVTANALSGNLTPGEIYSYDLYFQTTGGDAPLSAPHLSSPGILRSPSGIGPQNLGYGTFNLPTFALSPTDLNSLRLIHGSCRKPHGPARDALSALHGMLTTTAANPAARPHLLLLTGDQIYADDVAGGLLFMAIDAGAALGFPLETLPNNVVPRAPSLRAEQVRAAGITSDINYAKSHLIRFAEYCMMYLFAWSDVLWQGAEYPDYEVATTLPRGLRIGNTPFGIYTRQLQALNAYRMSLGDVRRALANVPTYMIFDDHEVTDDWFLDRAWVERSLNDPLLQRIVQNGLAAYSVFQGWGNVPSLFQSGGNGALLLTALSNWIQSPTDGSAATLRGTLGLPTGFPANRESYSRATTAVPWHYSISGPSYQVLVLDCRTRRGYPVGGGHQHPGLLSDGGASDNALNEQIAVLQPPTPEQVLVVVAPAPVAGSPALEAFVLNDGDPYKLDPEFWDIRPRTFERFLARLASTPTATGGTKRARIVLLSGDVHYGFAARLRYRATAPLGEPAAATEAVFAQFTASAFKNESPAEDGAKGTIGLHTNSAVAAQFMESYTGHRLLDDVIHYGWNNPTGGDIRVGTLLIVGPTPILAPMHERGTPVIYDAHPRLFSLGTPPQTPAPDWRLRYQFILSDDERNRLVTPPPTQQVPFPPPGNRNAALQAHLAALGNHNSFRQHGHGKRVVGLNNVGEISFQWGADDDKTVTQELWWWLDTSPNPFPLSRFPCPMSLAPEIF